MARKSKIGIDYFSHDVHCTSDRKLRLLKAKHGVVGYGMYFLLLEEIYKEGYCIHLTDEFNILFIDEHNLDEDVCNNVLNDSIKYGLFNSDIHEKYSVLTSKRIQENYLEACARRKAIEIDEHILMINVDILPDNVIICTQKKREEKKGDKKKREEKKTSVYEYSDSFENFWNNSSKTGSKRNAFTEFKKTLKDVSVEVLVENFKLQIDNEHFKGSDGTHYIPHVERWLKNGRWEDEVKVFNPNADPF